MPTELKNWPIQLPDFLPPFSVAVPLVGSLIISGAYLASHPYPTSVAGLYLAAGEQVVSTGQYPIVLENQIIGGLPLAYPPVGIFVLGVLQELGFDWRTITRWLPQLYRLLYTLAAFWAASAYFDDARKTVVAAIFVAIIPQLFAPHVNAGGSVRGLAMLFTIVNIGALLRGLWWADYRYALLAGFASGLAVLTHPTVGYIAFLTNVAISVSFVRSKEDLAIAGTVAIIAGVLCAWWAGAVVSTFGFQTLFAPLGSRPGVGIDITTIAHLTGLFFSPTPFLAIASMVGILGILFSVGRRRYFLLIWYVVLAIGFTNRVGFGLVIAFGAGEFLVDGVEALTASEFGERNQLVALAFSGLLIAQITGVGVVTASGFLLDDESLPPGLTGELDESDMDAIRSIKEQTQRGSSFAVQGDRGEWVPYFTDRPLALGPWGREWVGDYRRHVELQQRFTQCQRPECLRSVLMELEDPPTHLYLRRSTVFEDLVQSAPWLDIQYRNEGVLIVRLRPDWRRR